MFPDFNAPDGITFLSIQAQDFIEDCEFGDDTITDYPFLSIQAQDFIEDTADPRTKLTVQNIFLSIQAQDFIEDTIMSILSMVLRQIPEHSSSGLH